INELALAGSIPCFQGEKNTGQREHSRSDVGHGMTAADALASFDASDANEAARRLQDQIHRGLVSRRAGLAVSGDRTVDQPRVAAFCNVIAEPQTIQSSRPHVLNEHVDALDQVETQSDAFRLFEIDGEAALAGIDAEEI